MTINLNEVRLNNESVAGRLINGLQSISAEIEVEASENRGQWIDRDYSHRTRMVLGGALDSWVRGTGSDELSDITDSELLVSLGLLGAIDTSEAQVVVVPTLQNIRPNEGSEEGRYFADIYREVRTLLAGVAIGRKLIKGQEARKAMSIAM